MIKRNDDSQADDSPARLTLTQPPRPNPRPAALLILTVLAGAAFWLGVRLHVPRLIAPPSNSNPMVTARFFAMGHGCSLLLISPDGRAVLIDTGTTLTEEHALKAVLRRAGIGALSAVIITSCRAQAIGGLPRLISSIPVRGPILIPVPLDRFLVQGGRAARICRQAVERRGLTMTPCQDYLDGHSGVLGANTALTSRLIAGDPAEADVIRFEAGRSTLVYLGNLSQGEEESALSLRGVLTCDTLVMPNGDGNGAVHELIALSSAQTIVVPASQGTSTTSQAASELTASDAHLLTLSSSQPVGLGLSAQSDAAQVLRETAPSAR